MHLLSPNCSSTSKRGESTIPTLDILALFAPICLAAAESVGIAVFLTGSVFDQIRELCQDFQPARHLASWFSPSTQPYQRRMIHS